MRLIDADALIGVLLTENQRCITSTGHELTMNMIVSFVNNQPTAYDIEKVVAELEYQKEYFEKDRTYWADHTWKDNVAYCNWDLSDKKVNCYESAIDIVRKGGVE